MKPSSSSNFHPIQILKPFLCLLSLSFFLFLLFQLSPKSINPPPLDPPKRVPSASEPNNNSAPLLQIRSGYKSYDDYIARQLSKTLNPRLRHLWATRDWARKVRVFSSFFSALQAQGLLRNSSRALSIGARVGQEVVALKSIGVRDSVGIDLVPSPPLVVRGDFHSQPFNDSTFDFEFSNVFDHALYPEKFVSEIERTLRPGGVCVLHVALHRKGDKYSANDLLGVEGVINLFKNSELVRVGKVDGFGLDTEVVFRKNIAMPIKMKMKMMTRRKLFLK